MIPISSPLRSIHHHWDEIEGAIQRVLRSGSLILGPENEALSEELTAYLGCGFAIPVGNGTDALEIALLSVGVRPGKRVITVANAGGYASAATHKLGAFPLYVDISDMDLEMSLSGPFGLEEALQSFGTVVDAIVVTHLYGKAAPVERIVDLAERYQVPVIEDCAQAFGAEVGGRKVGTFGTVATTSFYPTKNLGALGDGGAIFTSDQDVANRALSLRQYGWSERYNSQVCGGRNSRLDEIQAAVLRFRLARIDQLNGRRQEIQQRYADAARDNELITVPHSGRQAYVAHLSVILTDFREVVRKQLAERGIATGIHYPLPDYRQAAFSQFARDPLPATERQVSRILTVPLFPELEESEIRSIEEALGEITL